ncbi:MAG: Hsp20/alpha crystallin family protein [Nitrospirae bacterium]|nr:Hsp20/alpha crystallin family protein [Nitrospirota bacterium]
MAVKGSKELVKSERPRWLSPFDEMERLFENVWSRPFPLFRSPLWPEKIAEEEMAPSVDIYEEGNELVVKADLPGCKKEDIKIDIVENLMTITGEKKREEKASGEDYYRFERFHGSFTRTFELPIGMDTAKAKAHYENGVLEVRIPKSEEAAKRSKKIEIE